MKRRKKYRKFNWDNEPLLGVIPDRALAHMLLAHVSAVRAARVKRGLPVAPSPYGPKWIQWDKQPLGQMTDAQLAKQIGVTPIAVFLARRKRDIPAFTRQQSSGKSSGRGIQKGIQWDKQPLGQMSDPRLAKQLGVTHKAVCQARRVRNIPSFTEQQRAKKS